MKQDILHEYKENTLMTLSQYYLHINNLYSFHFIMIQAVNGFPRRDNFYMVTK